MKKIILIGLVFLSIGVNAQYYTPIDQHLIRYSDSVYSYNSNFLSVSILNSYTQSAEGEDLVNSKNNSVSVLIALDLW